MICCCILSHCASCLKLFDEKLEISDIDKDKILEQINCKINLNTVSLEF